MASDIVFDNAVVVSHDSYRKGYSSKLNDLSIRDYKTGGFNDKIICIDLDRYERSEFPQLLNNTMDAAIGISNLHNNRRVSQRLLLVELRLGYKSDGTLSGTELRRKSSHSRELLGMDVAIDSDDYFIFDNKIIEKSRRTVNNLAIENGYADRWHCLTVEEFNNFIQDAEYIPYIPYNSPEGIADEIMTCGKDIDCLINISSKWIEEARKYVNRYNFNETEIICNAVIDSLNSVIEQYQFDETGDQWYIEDIISDFQGVLFSIKK